jgi:hypothetical protein
LACSISCRVVGSGTQNRRLVMRGSIVATARVFNGATREVCSTDLVACTNRPRKTAGIYKMERWTDPRRLVIGGVVASGVFRLKAVGQCLHATFSMRAESIGPLSDECHQFPHSYWEALFVACSSARTSMDTAAAARLNACSSPPVKSCRVLEVPMDDKDCAGDACLVETRDKFLSCKAMDRLLSYFP